MAVKSCETCEEAKKEIMDHINCQYLPGDRHRSTWESYAAICAHHTKQKICSVECEYGGKRFICGLTRNHEGLHASTEAGNFAWGLK